MPPAEGADRPHKIFLDCDPGIDDALAIAFACGHPGLDLRGVSTVAGNVGLEQTTANALSVLEFIGCPGVPVAAGSPRPLLRPPVEARHVHGDTGLGAAHLPPALGRPRDTHAVDLLMETVGASPGEVTLVATGPLTNIALAVRRYPHLASQVARFVIMGGSASRGNVTPAAEFNIACDPEAAAIVFTAGWQVTMVGLDVTLQARASAAVQERMRALGRLGADLLLPGLSGYRGEDSDPAGPDAPVAGGSLPSARAAGGGPPVHDVCALALVAEPARFGCRPARVLVETAGALTSGMTVTDFRPGPGECNSLVALSVDVPGFWDLVLPAYARLPAGRDAQR